MARYPALAARTRATLLCVAVLCLPASHAIAAEALRLRDALAEAALRDLSLPVFAAHADAVAASVRQAGVTPNPVVGVDLENFAATGPHGLVDHAETTLYYQQQLERADKRSARVAAAAAEREIVAARRVVRALDLFRQVQELWAEAVAAEAVLRLAQEQRGVAASLRDDVQRRVAAARDPLFAGSRADTALAQADIAVATAQTAAANARAALASYLGRADLAIDSATIENVDALSATPVTTADLALLEREMDAADARTRFERVRLLPDITLKGGVRSFGITDEVALVIGGSMPLGINDTNRGNIARAEAERLALERERAAARAQRDREIVRLRARLDAHLQDTRRLATDILPKAEETLRLVRDGFQEGGFSYLDVIEAQRALIDIQAQRLAALKAFHVERAAYDRLTDRFADLVPPATESLP